MRLAQYLPAAIDTFSMVPNVHMHHRREEKKNKTLHPQKLIDKDMYVNQEFM